MAPRDGNAVQYIAGHGITVNRIMALRGRARQIITTGNGLGGPSYVRSLFVSRKSKGIMALRGRARQIITTGNGLGGPSYEDQSS